MTDQDDPEADASDPSTSELKRNLKLETKEGFGIQDETGNLLVLKELWI